MTRFQNSLLRIGITSVLGLAVVLGVDAKQAYDAPEFASSACHHQEGLFPPSHRFREEPRMVGNHYFELDYDFILERPNALLTDPTGSN